MSSMGNGTPGQQGNPPRPGQQPMQSNTVGSGNLYATQGGNIHINQGPTPAKRRMRVDTKVLLITLVLDLAFFFYGMQAYTGGQDARGDGWRAFSFLFLVFMTLAMIGRWVRRRI